MLRFSVLLTNILVIILIIGSIEFKSTIVRSVEFAKLNLTRVKVDNFIGGQRHVLNSQFFNLFNKVKYQKIEKIPTTPPTTDCICVPYYLCNINGTIITDGIGTIDVRFRRCTGDLEVCCKLPNTTASMAPIITPTVPTTKPPTTPTTKPPTTPTTKPPTTPTTKPPTTPTTKPPTTVPTAPPIIFPTVFPTGFPGLNCICVQSWLCDPQGVVGTFGEGVINPRQQVALCPIAGQVCCRLPLNFPVTVPPTQSQQPQICFLCGNTLQCINNGIAVSSGTNILQSNQLIACTNANQGCCQGNIPLTLVNTNLVGPPKFPGTPNACYCVKFWLCSEGNIVTLDVSGIIDPRFTICKSPNEVCCRPTGILVQTQLSRDAESGQDALVVNGAAQVVCGLRDTTYAPAQPYPAESGKTYFAEFPWMAALLTKQADQKYLFQCGASMINSRVILTAAHCVVNRQIEMLVVRIGQWDLKNFSEPFQEIPVRTIIAHPLYYNSGLFHDVALLILDSSVTYARNVVPICLPQQDMFFPAGTRCYSTGWGRNAYGENGQYQSELRKIDLPIIDRSECQTRLKNTKLGPYFQLHESFLCAGGEAHRDTCQGDGGGPLVCPTVTGQFVQAGIVSWGVGCGESNTPAVYASVARHKQWIEQQLANFGV